MADAWLLQGIYEQQRRYDAVVKELASYEEAIAAGKPLPVARIPPPWQRVGLEQTNSLLANFFDKNGVSTDEYLTQLRKVERAFKRRLLVLKEENIRGLQSVLFQARKELDAAEEFRTRAAAQTASFSPEAGESDTSARGAEI
ncbi:hypothetical protein V492_00096 [Pseudogymnoascus sp. VKM F-4246]|nr:hypothetical protein V492_00096 [Pseudogymnoascus sp. VKM F-4246]